MSFVKNIKNFIKKKVNFSNDINNEEKESSLIFKSNFSETNNLSVKKLKIFSNLSPIKKFQKSVLIIKNILAFNDLYKFIKLYGSKPKLKKINIKNKYRNFQTKKKIIKISKYLINPKGIFFSIWNVLMFLLILYTLIFMPFFMVFYPDLRNKDLFENYINYFFILDIFINFNTAYLDNNNNLITNRKKISLIYLKSYFIIDFFSSIPFDLVFDFYTTSSQANNFLKFLKIPRLMKMMKMTKISFFNKLIQNNEKLAYKFRIKMGLIKILKLGTLTLLILHLVGCLWAYLGYNVNENFNWIKKSGINGDNKFLVYTSSIYYCFVTLTTVGYGDITPVNYLEIIFTIIWMMVGVSFYSLIISIITTFFQNRISEKSLLVKKLQKVEEFCKENNINKILKEKIIESLKYTSKKISYLWLEKEYDIFNELSLELKYDFWKELYKDLLKNNPFFTGKEISFIVNIVPLLKPIKLKKDDYFWKKGDYSNNIYFIIKGEVNFYTKNHFYLKQKTSKFVKNIINYRNKVFDENNFNPEKINLINNEQWVFKTMGPGSFFGEEEIIYKVKRFYNVKAKTNVETLILSATDYEKYIIDDFPSYHKELINIVEKKILLNKKWEDKIQKFLRAYLINNSKIKISDENFWENLEKSMVLNENYQDEILNKNILEVNDYIDIHKEKTNLENIVDINNNLSSSNSNNSINSVGLEKLHNDWLSKILILKNKNKFYNFKENEIEIKKKIKFASVNNFNQSSFDDIEFFQSIYDDVNKIKNNFEKENLDLVELINNLSKI